MSSFTMQARTWTMTDFLRLAGSFVPAAVLTWAVHEGAHWLAGISLGYEMWVTLNQAGPVQGHYDGVAHEVLIAMAGPVITWIQAIVAFVVIRKTGELWIYSFLFLPFWMRTAAMVFSFISHPNDEAKASVLMGMPMWILPTVSVSLLLCITFFASRYLKAGWITNVLAFVCSSLVTAGIIFTDQWLF